MPEPKTPSQIKEFPRRSEKDKTPRGITFSPKPSFLGLNKEIQDKIKRKQIALEQAWLEMFSEYENSFTKIIPENIRKSIDSLAFKIIQQNEHSREVFGKLNKDEIQNFYNSLSLHFTNDRLTEERKNLKSQKDTDGHFLDLPTQGNLYISISTLCRLDRNFLSMNYSLEQLHAEAKRLEDKGKKETLAKKYAAELVIFIESVNLGTPEEEIDYTANLKDKKLEAELYKIFLENSSSNWHKKCLELGTKDNSFRKKLEEILTKIKNFQDKENENRKARGNKPDSRYTGQITDSFLSILNPDREIEKVENIFEVKGEHFQIYELFTKAQLKEESETLGHCVGNGNEYFQAIRDGEIQIFSLRDDEGVAKWTIEYEIKSKSIKQFKGGGDEPVNSLPEESDLPMQTFTTLEKSGIIINKVEEDFDYNILKIKNKFTKVEDSDIGVIIKNSNSPENKIIKLNTLTLEKNTTKTELEILTQIPDISLDLTNIDPELKRKITSVQGNLIDLSENTDYAKLKNIGGYADFNYLANATGFESLVNIGGDAYFTSLTNATGLKSLVNIGGTANFSGLTSATSLKVLSNIGGSAIFKRLTAATGLKSLVNIGIDADFGYITTANGLEALVSIGGYAFFNRLIDATGLEVLSNIGEHGYFNRLTEDEKLKIPALNKK